MLEIVQIETTNQQGSTLTARDGRTYKIVRVTQEPEFRNGRKVIPTSRMGTKVVFDSDPSGRMNPLFNMVEVGALMEGSIQTVATKPYFIPSRNGKDESDGQIGNWVYKYTATVLEGESIYQLANNNDLEPIDEDGNVLDNQGNPLPSAAQIGSDQSASDDQPF